MRTEPRVLHLLGKGSITEINPPHLNFFCCCCDSLLELMVPEGESIVAGEVCQQVATENNDHIFNQMYRAERPNRKSCEAITPQGPPFETCFTQQGPITVL